MVLDNNNHGIVYPAILLAYLAEITKFVGAVKPEHKVRKSYEIIEETELITIISHIDDTNYVWIRNADLKQLIELFTEYDAKSVEPGSFKLAYISGVRSPWKNGKGDKRLLKDYYEMHVQFTII